MARNRSRRNQSGTMWLFPALKAGVLCTMLGGSAIGYVLQKNQLIELGRTITRREAALEKLKWENKLRSQQLASYLLPQNIAQRVRDQRLGLMPPQPGQTIWLVDPETSRSVVILNTDSRPGNTHSRTNR
jgi:hypothetical protein